MGGAAPRPGEGASLGGIKPAVAARCLGLLRAPLGECGFSATAAAAGRVGAQAASGVQAARHPRGQAVVSRPRGRPGTKPC